MSAFLPRALSVAVPLMTYAALGLLAWALWKKRHLLDRWVPLVVVLALLASFVAVEDGHTLFFDEDIYIQIASNLSYLPVAQLTVVGSPEAVGASTYYKEPAGYPALLGLVFAIAGASEEAAFLFARVLFALAAAAVYLLARDQFRSRWMGGMSALVFMFVPAVLEHSASAATDIPALLFAVVGFWGLVSGGPALAVAGFALAAQIRLEPIVLIAFVLFDPAISRRWKAIGAALVSAEVLHVGWLLAGSSAYASAIGIESAFSYKYLIGNLVGSVGYLLDGGRFPLGITVLAMLALSAWGIARLRRHDGEAGRRSYRELHMAAWIGLLWGVYLVYYAGNLGTNPRYVLQIIVPLILLATSAFVLLSPLPRMAVGAGLAFSLVFALGSARLAAEGETVLTADHRQMAEIAGTMGPEDVVLTTEPEVFLNHGVAAANAVYVSERPDIVETLRNEYRRVWYYAGARSNVVGGEQWRADRIIRSTLPLRLVESYGVEGSTTELFELLFDPDDREGRLISPFKYESSCRDGRHVRGKEHVRETAVRDLVGFFEELPGELGRMVPCGQHEHPAPYDRSPAIERHVDLDIGISGVHQSEGRGHAPIGVA